MLIVKSENRLSTPDKKILSILSCHEVTPLVSDGVIKGLSCQIYGADNQTGQSFERTIKLSESEDDDLPVYVYVENSHGRTVQHYVSSKL